MGKNYYDILGVPKGADDAAIKKAYKKAALKYHPDRPGGDKVKFQEVSEAFEVLSDSKKRQLYDQFGEAGLNPGAVPDNDAPGNGAGPFPGAGGAGGMPGGTFFRTTHTGGAGGSPFHGSDPFSVFESMFGTMDVDQAMDGGGGGGGFASFPVGRSSGLSGMRMGGMGGGMPGGMSPTRRQQAPPVEHILNISLEDLYKGTTKRMRITKKTPAGDAQVDKTIVVKPGWKDGTRITYEKEGDEQPGVVPADIVFVIKTKPHPRFERDGNNLLHTAKITLEQALTGFEIRLETLDGRQIPVRESCGIGSSLHKSTVRGEGMPSQKDRQVRGDLIIRYDIRFPPPARTEDIKRRRRDAVAGL